MDRWLNFVISIDRIFCIISNAGTILHFMLARGLILVTKDGSEFARRGLFRIPSRTPDLESRNRIETIKDEKQRLCARKFWLQEWIPGVITII